MVKIETLAFATQLASRLAIVRAALKHQARESVGVLKVPVRTIPGQLSDNRADVELTYPVVRQIMIDEETRLVEGLKQLGVDPGVAP